MAENFSFTLIINTCYKLPCCTKVAGQRNLVKWKVALSSLEDRSADYDARIFQDERNVKGLSQGRKGRMMLTFNLILLCPNAGRRPVVNFRWENIEGDRQMRFHRFMFIRVWAEIMMHEQLP